MPRAAKTFSQLFRPKIKPQDNRESAAKRGYGRAWQKASKAFLMQHPLCMCDECGEGVKRVTPATVVDHRIPHRGDMRLFWDQSNWQSMSKEHHDRKTAKEDQGFGNIPGGG
jgi:5-methylcytosine-specific restriction protein A